MPGGPEVTFLVVEDDEVSVMAIRRALSKLKLTNPVIVANDGFEGLAALRDANAAQYIVLLDFHMPGMNGSEFLEELQRHPELQASLASILTTSDTFHERAEPVSQLVTGRIAKDNVYTTLKAALELAGLYWRIVPAPS